MNKSKTGKPRAKKIHTVKVSTSAKQMDKPSGRSRKSASTTVDEPLVPKLHPEIVIGLVGPIGVDLDPVVAAIERELKDVYSTSLIRLSDKIAEFFNVNYKAEPEHTRIRRLMRLGTRLREETKRGDAVALLGVEEIKRVREEVLDGKPAKHAYILRSLKTPQEVQMLRNVYGRGFLLISVYAPRSKRVAALADRISNPVHGGAKGSRARAEKLVEIDELEDHALGQDVQDAFPMADLFVYTHNADRMNEQIKRFIHLFFGYRFSTPTREEHGMLQAKSAAFRSSDMNRQVGAAIQNEHGDLLALGCNDVPKAHGGLYWADDSSDQRDFRRGVDAMAEQREQVLSEMLARLQQAKILDVGADKIRGLVKALIGGDKKHVLKGTAAMNILEFGRSVHAEMDAITTAARLGISVHGATLYCTTFPCHICARHIVASGIRRVVYVEPYPKSKARQLHADSISVDPDKASPDFVNFEPFEGIAPSKYFELFEANDSRKDVDGRVPNWSMSSGSPRFLRFLSTYTEIEDVITAKVIPGIRALGITTPTTAELDDEKEKV